MWASDVVPLRAVNAVTGDQLERWLVFYELGGRAHAQPAGDLNHVVDDLRQRNRYC
jgi:hypothetical protein